MTNKPDPYLVANQSTKSIKEKVCSSVYTLAQFTKVYKKMDLILGRSSQHRRRPSYSFLSKWSTSSREGQLSKLSPFSCPQRIHAIPGGSFSQRSASPIAPQKGRRLEAITIWPSHKTKEGDLWFPPHFYTKNTCWGCSNQISSGDQW